MPDSAPNDLLKLSSVVFAVGKCLTINSKIEEMPVLDDCQLLRRKLELAVHLSARMASKKAGFVFCCLNCSAHRGSPLRRSAR